jgi:3',5'-cyclic AMP phosphodiesterase CpdA
MKIIHLSDLHFGTERSGVVDLLISDIKTLKPDIIIVSGDLTQRALTSQFHAAKYFLNRISTNNIVCVPGNHDISLYNLIERFFYPFSKYQRFINENLSPYYCKDDLAILGINSVTPFKPMGGFVTQQQLDYVRNFFQVNINSKIKIIVMHHNLIRSERHKIINDSEKIISVFADCQVNLVLSGHIHYAYIEQLRKKTIQHNMYIVTAGTPISTRTAAPNSFNIIELNETEFKLSVRELKDDKFMLLTETVFQL